MDVATQAEGGEEDEAGGGVAQSTLQHILQVGGDQQGAPVQGQRGSTAKADTGHEEGRVHSGTRCGSAGKVLATRYAPNHIQVHP